MAKRVYKNYPYGKRKKVRMKRGKKKAINVMLCLLTFFIIVNIFAVLETLNYFQTKARNVPIPETIFPEVGMATFIYDRNGVQLYRFHGDRSNNDKFSPDEITPLIKAVYMAAEDDEFYNHNGYNPQAISRCALNTLSNKDECGASTITQQLIKIVTSKNERTIDRKIEEILTASKVEEVYTKDEIFEKYLKVTPYGSNITGIKTGAKYYFGIENLQELSLAQIAVLASIINNPVNLSPTLSPDLEVARASLELRKEYIFDQLELKLDLINQQLLENGADQKDLPTLESINSARSEVLSYKEPIIPEIKAGHFVTYTLNELLKRNYKNGEEPFTLSDIQNGGYKIYTSLDYNLQQTAERYVEYAGNNYKYWNVHNAAVMTAKPSTGEILTMAGSKSFFGQSEGCDSEGKNCKYDPQVNVLTSLQSPGSTNKVLGYYLAFAESKLFPGSFLPDVPIQFGDYQPKNWDGSFMGVNNTTAREMLRLSRNIPALIIINSIGVNKYLDTSRSFGYTSYSSNDNYGPSVILGGADIYPVEHVQAFGVFANQGDRVDLNPILKIEDRNGNIIYEANPQRQRVADPSASYLLNQTLNRLDTGIGESIAWDERDVAGKTGTTENNKDSFLVMYSPDFVTLGWVGNNNNDPLDFNYGWPAFVVAPWLKGYMSEIGNTPYFSSKTAFSNPGDVYYGGGDCDAFGRCLGVKPDFLIRGREPQRGDISYGYVNKKEGDIEVKQTTITYRMLSPDLQKFLDQYLYRTAFKP